jgi:hypothetical protein
MQKIIRWAFTEKKKAKHASSTLQDREGLWHSLIDMHISITSSDKIHTGKFNCLRRTTASALASIGSESEYNFACNLWAVNSIKILHN